MVTIHIPQAAFTALPVAPSWIAGCVCPWLLWGKCSRVRIASLPERARMKLVEMGQHQGVVLEAAPPSSSLRAGRSEGWAWPVSEELGPVSCARSWGARPSGLKEGHSGWFSWKKEWGKTERLPCPWAPQSPASFTTSSQIYLPPNNYYLQRRKRKGLSLYLNQVIKPYQEWG